ncbi:MAG: hypothetical protein J2P17_18985, partial [Mycobacterium sp.]|nr:hypothetical protein [Mycobacterium sp.]
LTPYVNPQHRHRLDIAAQQITDPGLRGLLVEAALFELAIDSKRTGHSTNNSTTAPHLTPPPTHNGTDLDTEIQLLRSITNHHHLINALIQHSPQSD